MKKGTKKGTQFDCHLQYALDPDNNIIQVVSAKKGEEYHCPACEEQLVFRAGKIRVHHFAHKPNSVCSGETALHYIAKLHVAKVVQDWIDGKQAMPKLLMPCTEYHRFSKCDTLIPKSFSAQIDRVEVEKQVESGRIPDVSLYAGKDLILGVEILVTHRVDPMKSRQMGCPWIEIRAQSALESSSEWIIYRHNIPVGVCVKCEYKDAQQRKEILDHVWEHNLILPPKPYRFAMWECPYCGNSLINIWWDGWYSAPNAQPPKWGDNGIGKKRYKEYRRSGEYCDRFCDAGFIEDNLFFGLPALKNYALEGSRFVRVPPRIESFVPLATEHILYDYGQKELLTILDKIRMLFPKVWEYNGFNSYEEFENKLLADAGSEAARQRARIAAQYDADMDEGN